MSFLTDQLRLAVIVLIICLLPLNKAYKKTKEQPLLEESTATSTPPPLLEDEYDDDDTVFVADDDQLLERSVGDRQNRTEVDSLHAFFFTDKNRHNNFFVAISFF